MIYIDKYSSPVGELTMASDGESLIGLWFDGQKYFMMSVKSEKIATKSDLPVFDDTKRWLDIYFSGISPDFLPKIKLSGSHFRQAVGKIMLEIPYGKTTTYGEIAKKLAKRENKTSVSAQAVGGAVGHNPISVIVPCHRVIGADGSLTGYAGGLDKKIWLLTCEGICIKK